MGIRIRHGQRERYATVPTECFRWWVWTLVTDFANVVGAATLIYADNILSPEPWQVHDLFAGCCLNDHGVSMRSPTTIILRSVRIGSSIMNSRIDWIRPIRPGLPEQLKKIVGNLIFHVGASLPWLLQTSLFDHRV